MATFAYLKLVAKYEYDDMITNERTVKLFQKMNMFANLAYPLFLAIALRLLWLAKKTHTGRHWLVAAPSLAILFHKQHTHRQQSRV